MIGIGRYCHAVEMPVMGQRARHAEELHCARRQAKEQQAAQQHHDVRQHVERLARLAADRELVVHCVDGHMQVVARRWRRR